MAKFRYSGPPVFVVELDSEVVDGDVVEASDALGCASGFEPAGKSASSGADSSGSGASDSSSGGGDK